MPKEKGTTWVEPVIVVEVEYSERTDDGLLRQPVFLRFRDDKRPEECVREGVGRWRWGSDGEREGSQEQESGEPERWQARHPERSDEGPSLRSG